VRENICILRVFVWERGLTLGDDIIVGDDAKENKTDGRRKEGRTVEKEKKKDEDEENKTVQVMREKEEGEDERS
jgi:hypothetical protein